MNRAQYQVSLDRTKSLLRKSDLCKGLSPRYNIGSYEIMRVSTIGEYITVYHEFVEMFKYDFLLFDDSILQYSYERDQNSYPIIKYSYYQFPFDFPTYEEYLLSNYITYEEAGELFRYDYEQEITEASARVYLTPIRYDYDVTRYTGGVHSASHIHIGYMNSIRIPVCMILTPFIFTLFVIKQCYYDHWLSLFSNEEFRNSLDTSKQSCMQLHADFFSEVDKKELFLK